MPIKTPITPSFSSWSLAGMNMWIELHNNCFTLFCREAMSWIYALFWRTFSRPRNGVGEQKMTNIRYESSSSGSRYWPHPRPWSSGQWGKCCFAIQKSAKNQWISGMIRMRRRETMLLLSQSATREDVCQQKFQDEQNWAMSFGDKHFHTVEKIQTSTLVINSSTICRPAPCFLCQS